MNASARVRFIRFFSDWIFLSRDRALFHQVGLCFFFCSFVVAG
jgi:hypothetical protein